MNTRVHAKPTASPAPTFTPVRPGFLQRCGSHDCPPQGCNEDRKRRFALQRRPASQAQPTTVPAIVNEVLRSPGQPLDGPTRAFMEPRFGHDFGRVRVHTDAKAAESARAVNALAYTVGRDVVFGTGRYSPATSAGRRLVAHELTHVVQQKRTASAATSGGVSAVNDPAEHEADAVVHRIAAGEPGGSVCARSGPAVQRKVKVDKPNDKIPRPGGKGLDQTNAATVSNYLATLCSGGSAAVNGKTGDATINKAFCTPKSLLPPPFTTEVAGAPGRDIALAPAYFSKQPTGCSCLCDLVASPHLWTIKVDDSSWPHTTADDHAAALGKKPGGTGGTVTTSSPNSPKLWGFASASGKLLDYDPWLVLGHELCGHGWLFNFGKGEPDVAKPRGEGGHQETVRRENELRREHGIELRGTFKDPHCGESFWRDKKSPTKVNWSGYRAICADWRAAYNKKHGTSYKITDRIP